MLHLPKTRMTIQDFGCSIPSKPSVAEYRLMGEAMAISSTCGEKEAVAELFSFVSGLSIPEMAELARLTHYRGEDAVNESAASRGELPTFLMRFALHVIRSFPELKVDTQGLVRLRLLERLLSQDCDELNRLSAQQVDDLMAYYDRIRATCAVNRPRPLRLVVH